MFLHILRRLVTAVPGSIGALFLDYEGETVSMLSERPFDIEDDDLRMFGAYQGIFLTQLRALTARVDAGTPVRFKLEFARTRAFTCDLQDGYYLVLLVDPGTSEALVWRQLEVSRRDLLAEL